MENANEIRLRRTRALAGIRSRAIDPAVPVMAWLMGLMAFAAIAFSALILSASGATAQSGPRWDRWDGGPSWQGQRPGWQVYGDDPDDDDDGEFEDDDERDDDDAPPSRRHWRDGNWDRGDDDDAEDRRRHSRKPYDRRRDWYDENEFDAPDTPREPADRGEWNGNEAANGGPRPFITPQAPLISAFPGTYAAGSIIIDASKRKLYYVLSPGRAFAYPIGVGREGFAWTGSEKVSRIAEWPDWYPPVEMRKRKPELPERMTGGINNPLGAKAIYLGNTLYRIHGTNDPKSIGRAESSGCFRMLNAHVLHLASLVIVGTPVRVVKSLGPKTVASGPTTPPLKPSP